MIIDILSKIYATLYAIILLIASCVNYLRASRSCFIPDYSCDKNQNFLYIFCIGYKWVVSHDQLQENTSNLYEVDQVIKWLI